MGDAERGPESRVRFRGGDGRGLVDKGDLPQDGSGGLRHTGSQEEDAASTKPPECAQDGLEITARPVW